VDLNLRTFSSKRSFHFFRGLSSSSDDLPELQSPFLEEEDESPPSSGRAVYLDAHAMISSVGSLPQRLVRSQA
jgi:hypothetical protein